MIAQTKTKALSAQKGFYNALKYMCTYVFGFYIPHTSKLFKVFFLENKLPRWTNIQCTQELKAGSENRRKARIREITLFMLIARKWSLSKNMPHSEK